MKGVILAAGFGTRFLPGTKSIPKEMFPLIDRPAIDLIVKEMCDAGIRDILIVTSRRKKALEDYFDREVELESSFMAEEDQDKLRSITPPDANIFFLRQKHMAGTGDALMLVEPFVGESPFVVAYPDDVQITGPSISGQLIEMYEKTGCTVLAGQALHGGDLSRYGVIAVDDSKGPDVVKRVVEKPPPGTEPSRIVSYGRYLYTKELFTALKATRPAISGSREFTQTDAVNYLAEKERVALIHFEGRLLDVGTPEGYLRSIVEYGLNHPEFRVDFQKYLESIVQR